MLVSEVQPLKAETPIYVTLSGIITFVSEVQPLKADPPMLVTLFPIVTLLSEVQYRNAESAMVFVPCLISILPETSSLASIK